MADRPDKKRTRKGRRKLSVIAALISLYAVYCLLLYIGQTGMIFPGALAGTPADVPPVGVEELTLSTEDGEVYAWYAPAPEATPTTPAPLVVFNHGNAELLRHQTTIVEIYHGLGVSVLLPEYRGYGRAAGTPNQTTLVADAIAFLDQVSARPEVDAERLVLHGRSIGGFVAAQVAITRPPRALILQSTGLSLHRRAWRYGVPPALLRSPFRTDHAIRDFDCPTLLIHGTHDAIFRVSEAEELAELAQSATLKTYPGGHNSPLPPFYADWLREHLIRAGILVK